MDGHQLAVFRQDRVARKFLELITAFRPALICDIGSLNAVDAQQFRKFAPWARVIAYEANTYNYDVTIRNSQPWESQIEFIHMAISSHDGIAEFNVVKYDRSSGEYDWRGGASSLKPRMGHETERVLVASRQLDSHLKELGLVDIGKALWIDVEGAADIVLSGAGRSLESTLFLKIEVERKAFWEGQALDKEILSMLHGLGFEQIDSSITDDVDQYDVLMIRRDIINLFGNSGTLFTSGD